MDWLTPVSEVHVAYSEAPTPYEYDYEGSPAFVLDNPSFFAFASERARGLTVGRLRRRRVLTRLRKDSLLCLPNSIILVRSTWTT